MATIGSTRAARNAGRAQAPSPTSDTRPATARKVTGSWGGTPKSIPWRNRAATADPAKPESDAECQERGAVGEDHAHHPQRIRAQAHPDPDLRRPAGDEEREHAADPDGGDGERHRAEGAHEERVEPLGRDGLFPDLRQRRDPLDRLVGDEVVDDPRGGRAEVLRAARVDHDGAGEHAHVVLRHRLVERRKRRGVGAGVAGVAHDADDGAPVAARAG